MSMTPKANDLANIYMFITITALVVVGAFYVVNTYGEKPQKQKEQKSINFSPRIDLLAGIKKNEMRRIFYGLYTVGYVNEDGSIIDPKRITYHPELDQIQIFASKHGYHNDEHMILKLELVYEDVHGNIEFQIADDSEPILFAPK